MSNARLILSKHFLKHELDKRLFGSFVEHMGSTVYGGIFEPGHPLADENGFRRDVLKLVQQLALPVIRYPGGNFTCSYFWEDTVGPVEQRPTRLELAWRQVEPNTFGLPEFMKWVKQAGAEPMMAVNLGTRGVQDAANIVEYCNHDGGTFYSDLRRKHGIEKPFNIKLWCVGNEVDGPWQIAHRTADDYGRTAAESAKAMCRVDPGLELVAVGSSTPNMDTYPEWDKTVLTHTYEHVDYISLHHYIDSYGPDLGEYLCRANDMDRQIQAIVAACDYVKAAKRSSKTMYLSFDEYNVTHHPPENYVPWQTGFPLDKASFDMKNALLFGSVLMTLMRNSDRVKIACQSLLVNTGPLIVTDRGGKAWVNTLYFPMMHASLYGRGDVMEQRYIGPGYHTEKYGKADAVDSVSIYRREDDEVALFAVNRTESALDFEIELHDFTDIRPIEHILLHNDDLEAVNSAEQPDAIHPVVLADITGSGRSFSCPLPPYSWNVIRMKCL